MNTAIIPFTVYNASAGAGKTYNLVLSYLRICLATSNSNVFKSILAITFTNKAAAEMKQRLIKALTEFSEYNEQAMEQNSMMLQLVAELNVKPGVLAQRATNTLRAILHGYSAFSVSTIDKFTNRLIRSFANELDLNGNYEVELDGKEMLTEAVDALLESLQEGSELSEALVAFMRTQLADGKSPRIENNLIEIGSGLFLESAQPFISLLEQTSLAEILDIRKQLIKRNKHIDKGLKNLAVSLLDMIDQQGIEHEWFSRGGVPKWLKKVMENELSISLPTDTIIKQINGDVAFFSKVNEKQYGVQLEVIQHDLQQGLQHLYQEMSTAFPTYHLSALLIQDLHALAVLREVDNALQTIKEDTNRLPIGEFNKLIGERLQEQAAPFLYERLGDRYKHFFIDEFQDTSILQWNNLTPLINNAMSEGEEANSAMLVGDGKQAIYRWRGGEVEQFLALSNDQHPSNKIKAGQHLVELYKRQTKQLAYNFRSQHTIVDFNNRFFTELGKTLESDLHQKLYSMAAQEPNGDKGGYVKVEMNAFDKETFAEEELHRIKQTIENCKNAGYKLGDIAILTRGAKEGKWIADYLFENKIEIVTAATLSFEQSAEANFVISFFKSRVYPKDILARIHVMEYLWKQYPSLSTKTKHTFLEDIKNQSIEQFNKQLSAIWKGYDAGLFAQFSLTEQAYILFRYLAFDEANDPFSSGFLDEVYNFQNKQNGDAAEFIDWWEKTGYKKQLNVEGDIDAVRLMTIHKSKGLEFPVIIMPFTDWKKKIGSAKEWIALGEENYFNLPAGRLSLKKDFVEHTEERYQYLYERSNENIALDNANLMYVAMTRAEQALFIFSSTERYDQSSRISTAYKTFIELNGEETIYETGILKKLEKVNAGKGEAIIETLDVRYTTGNWREKLKISVNVPEEWRHAEQDAQIFGRAVHEVLSKIIYAEDYTPNGQLMAEINSLVKEVLLHKELNMFYKAPMQILNERDILLTNGEMSRPDRVILDGNVAHILDYKTGAPYAKHETQLRDYGAQLLDAGYQLGQLKLVYLDKAITIKTL